LVLIVHLCIAIQYLANGTFHPGNHYQYPKVQHIDSFWDSNNYTEQNYKRNTLVFARIFHELFQLNDLRLFLCTQKAYVSQILFKNQYT